MALKFKLIGKDGKSARAGECVCTHHVITTPVFMPVGTQGTMKGLASSQLLMLDVHILLSNTYHLGMRPGAALFESHGDEGLHRFMDWPRNILTDSGGFQMVSLAKLSEVTEEGVTFESPHDGSKMVLTPEESIAVQNAIGADIIMALDDVVSSTVTGPRVEEACHRTLRWLDRCIAAHSRKDSQALFPIVQGGLDPKLREICMAGIIARQPLGFAIGGLSGGEEKDSFWRIVAQCTEGLPKDRPRYLMGVGYPVDLVVCTALGVDMFDCVYPTRTARFGTALIWTGQIHLKSKEYEIDISPLDKDCKCYVCTNYTRAFIHASLFSKGQVGTQLLTYHNIAHQLRLMRTMRQAIIDGEFVSKFVPDYMIGVFPDKNYPQWIRNAMAHAEITLII